MSWSCSYMTGCL